MSSLAATQADGYYLPPEYFESGAYRKQSKNQFAATQESRLSSSATSSKRQKGHNQWLQNGVVRFELPYKGICGGCGQSIGRGTRYNARKTTVGTYFTTPIYQFELNCRQCHHQWFVETNPRERGFDYTKGIKLQAGQETNLALAEKRHDHFAGEDNGSDNPLLRLETAAQDKDRALTEMEELKNLQRLNEAATLNDADNNAMIRQAFRRDRKDKRSRLHDGAKKGWRNGMEVLPPSVHDTIYANDVVYGQAYNDERKRLLSVRKASIFSIRSNSIQNLEKRKKHRPSHRAFEDATASPLHSGCESPGTRKSRASIVADQMPSSSGAVTVGVGFVGKQTRRLQRIESSGVKLAAVATSDPSTSFSTRRRESTQDASFGIATNKPQLDTCGEPYSSFKEMMAAYESDEE